MEVTFALAFNILLQTMLMTAAWFFGFLQLELAGPASISAIEAGILSAAFWALTPYRSDLSDGFNTLAALLAAVSIGYATSATDVCSKLSYPAGVACQARFAVLNFLANSPW